MILFSSKKNLVYATGNIILSVFHDISMFFVLFFRRFDTVAYIIFKGFMFSVWDL